MCALLKNHHSSRSIPVPAVVQVAETAKVGIYHLSPAGKDKFTEFIPFSGDEQPEGDDIKLHGGMYYITRDIFNPDIGDLRVQFYYACRAGEMVSSEFNLLFSFRAFLFIVPSLFWNEDQIYRNCCNVNQ